jgi:hypothetical protein
MKYYEIINIIEKLNMELLKELSDEDYTEASYFLELKLSTWGHDVFIIEFLNNQIWCSEDDMREYTDEDEYEPLEYFLRRGINQVLNYISKIKI